MLQKENSGVSSQFKVQILVKPNASLSLSVEFACAYACMFLSTVQMCVCSMCNNRYKALKKLGTITLGFNSADINNISMQSGKHLSHNEKKKPNHVCNYI